jgi:hypothetical protein
MMPYVMLDEKATISPATPRSSIVIDMTVATDPSFLLLCELFSGLV